MIFGHFGLAFLFKSKFYKKSSIIFLLICCYLPDILLVLFFGIEWVIRMPYPPILYGMIRNILTLGGDSYTFIDDPSMPSHSVIIFLIFISIFLIFFIGRKKLASGLVYGGAIFSHLLFDLLLPDTNRLKPIVYPLYPFDSAPLEFYILDANLFWLIDLSIFILGFFVILWAFSRYEERGGDI